MEIFAKCLEVNEGAEGLTIGKIYKVIAEYPDPRSDAFIYLDDDGDWIPANWVGDAWAVWERYETSDSTC